MKNLLNTAGALVILMTAAGGANAQGKPESGRQVTVYFSDNAAVPYLVKAQAQGQASDMFASIGVALRWQPGRPSPAETDPIAVEFVTGTPASRLPGALAYARPYEGVHIQIFWDRIEAASFPRQTLAHVMVHEITHILQGIGRHSAEGIMKARWDNQDKRAMTVHPLGFTPEDVRMIYNGMAARSAHAPIRTALTMTASAAEVAVR